MCTEDLISGRGAVGVPPKHRRRPPTSVHKGLGVRGQHLFQVRRDASDADPGAEVRLGEVPTQSALGAHGDLAADQNRLDQVLWRRCVRQVEVTG